MAACTLFTISYILWYLRTLFTVHTFWVTCFTAHDRWQQQIYLELGSMVPHLNPTLAATPLPQLFKKHTTYMLSGTIIVICLVSVVNILLLPVRMLPTKMLAIDFLWQPCAGNGQHFCWQAYSRIWWLWGVWITKRGLQIPQTVPHLNRRTVHGS